MTYAHNVLGVAPNASADEVKQAYRQMVKLWHPDHFTHDPKLQHQAEQKLQEINHAFEELVNNIAVSDVKGFSPIVTEAQHVSTPPVFESGSSHGSGAPWPFIVVFLIVLIPLAFLWFQNAVNSRDVNSAMIAQDTGLKAQTGMHRYILGDPRGRGIYVIEGPRVPQEWEIEALLKAYLGQKPHVKQGMGNFTISQSLRPTDRDLIPLRYKAGEAS